MSPRARVSEMSTISHLTVEEELAFLREVAESRGWVLQQQDPLHFSLRLPASEVRTITFRSIATIIRSSRRRGTGAMPTAAGATTVPTRPQAPAFSIRTASFALRGIVSRTRQVDARGPHPEWVMGDWRNNPHTKGCKTLCAMALRIFVELNGPHYKKRVKPN